jgi:hypothetical protein
VAQGDTWDLILKNKLLSNEASDVKAQLYEQYFADRNNENAVFMQRISYRLSKCYYKQSLSHKDSQNYKEAHQFAKKAISYYDCCEEFFQKY